MPFLSRMTLMVAGYAMGVIVLCVLTLWYLVAMDKICLARTGAGPFILYRTDDSAFFVAVEHARTEALRALFSQFDEDTGFFIYERHPRGWIGSGNNDIRQLIASRILAKESKEDPSLGAVHAANLTAIMETWFREENGVGFVYADHKSKLGANAMLLRVLAVSPQFEVYEREAALLARGIISLMNDNGSFSAWLKEPEYAYDAEYLLTFYSGEAILALLEYAERSGNQEAYTQAVKAQEFYLGEYVERMDENYYPAYVPWHTLSLAILYEDTGELRYADAIFEMNDRLIELQDTEKFVGRFYDPEMEQYGTAHVSSDSVYTEGLAVAYRLARERGDAREVTYRESLTRSFQNLETLRFTPSWWRIADDEKAASELAGGFMTHACNRWIRIDSTAHAIDAFEQLERSLGRY